MSFSWWMEDYHCPNVLQFYHQQQAESHFRLKSRLKQRIIEWGVQWEITKHKEFSLNNSEDADINCINDRYLFKVQPQV